jgi:peptidoglycan/LPS O-acetylase OafA/YrhL
MTERTDQLESVALVVILAIVAVASGWASFTHVHDWTMRHAPTGTPDAFGWVNAVISELVPIAAFLVMRRRRRAGASIGYPLALLIAAAALSLAAQLAVAQPSPSGWLLSAVPALAFMGLVKLVLTMPITTKVAATAPMTDIPAGAPAKADPPADIRSIELTPRTATVVPVPVGAFTRPIASAAVSEATR